jgi:hypothetical protein
MRAFIDTSNHVGGYWPLINSANNHGRESDPDHEIGDLQDVVALAWRIMSQKQRSQLLVDCEELANWAEDKDIIGGEE